MAIIFEYGKWKSISNENSLNKRLQNIWKRGVFLDEEVELTEDNSDNRYQPFLKFYNKEIKANNYVGFIQNDEELIEIYPKVFKTNYEHLDYENQCFQEEKRLMLRHIFFWLNYCRKWKLPFTQASLDTINIDEFPELIINLMASHFLETISNQPMTMYQEIEEALITPKGSINFKRYLNNSLSHGNFHKIECDYEPFLFDNIVNRAIKYCSRLLMSQTKFDENVKILQDVIFILDEVEDIPCTYSEVNNIILNSFFEDYSFALDSCKLILNQQLYSSNTYDLSQWCLLFPMEYIFEDFLAGFLKQNFSNEWKVHYQKSNMNFCNIPPVFKMKHDIFLTHRKTEKIIIIDTKYKLRDKDFKNDSKKGVSQTDLYQMVSYAFKRACTDVILVYPNIAEKLNNPDEFEIISGFDANQKIKITAMEIPFWSLDKDDINSNFKGLEDKLFQVMKDQLDLSLKEAEIKIVDGA